MQEPTVISQRSWKDGARRLFVSSGESCQVLLAKLTQIGCLLVLVVAIAVLCGWIFDVPRLTRLLPGLASMKINTACGLILASIALWLLRTLQLDFSVASCRPLPCCSAGRARAWLDTRAGPAARVL
jgi:hypothetical protein